MLERSYDWVCLGENLFSLVFSLGALSNKKKTTILKDPRFNGTPAQAMMVDHLFVELLEHWGRDQQVAPLSNIRREIKPVSVQLMVNDIQLRLGGRPSENFVELARKLPFLFSATTLELAAQLQENPSRAERFDQELFETAARLARHLYLFRSMPTLTMQDLVGLLPPELSQWIGEIDQWSHHKNVQLTPQWWRWMGFVYIVSAHVRSRATLNLTYAELAYLMLQALLPMYGLKGEGLIDDLRRDFIRLGGVVRDTHIADWHFEEGRLWGLELSTYEGIVHPRDVFIFSDHLPTSCPLELRQRHDALRCVGLSLDYPAMPAAQAVLGVNDKELANECPFWKLSFDGTRVSILLFVKQRQGQLPSLYAGEFAKLLTQLHATWLWPCRAEGRPLNMVDQAWLRQHLSFKSEVIERPLQWDAWALHEREFPRFRPAVVGLQDHMGERRRPLTGVWYLGPHLGRFLGPVGTPLEMKQFLFSSKGKEKVDPNGATPESTL